MAAAGHADARSLKNWAQEKYAAIVVDANNENVLFARNADAARYPASLTKMMTLYMLFTELKSGRLKLDSRMGVSKHAAARPPSKLGLNEGSAISVRTAILALVTKSANDVAAVVAEQIGGTESGFAVKMTAKAHAIGMKNTTFRNASGLPDTKQHTTARDMATLAQALIYDFPEYFSYFKTRSFAYGGRYYGNHNRLLGRVSGVDGIKTGYTRASGFNLTTSARRGNRHLVAVVMGGPTGSARDSHMTSLLQSYFPKASTHRRPRVVRVVLPDDPPLPPRRTAAVEVASASAAAPVLASAKPKVLDAGPVDEGTTDEAEGDAETTGDVTAEPVLVPTAEPPQGGDQIASLLGSGTVSRRDPGQQTTVLTAAPALPRPVAPDAKVTSAIAEKLREPWLIQIGAYNSEEIARDRLRAAEQAADELRSRLAYTEAVSKASDTLYRARFSGFDRKGAEAACKALKRASFGCLAIPQ